MFGFPVLRMTSASKVMAGEGTSDMGRSMREPVTTTVSMSSEARAVEKGNVAIAATPTAKYR